MIYLLFAFLAGAMALTFPTVPNQYITTVSINFVEVGMTLAYDEFYDGKTGFLYTEGRVGPSDSNELIDYNKHVIYQWRPAPAECTFHTFAALGEEVPFAASTTFFFSPEAMEGLNFTYKGTDRDARGILCNVWQATGEFNFTGPGAEKGEHDGAFEEFTTITYYFASPDVMGGVTNIPIRVIRAGVVHNLSNPNAAPANYSHYYDWVQFIPGPPNKAVFRAPNPCTLTSTPAVPGLNFPTSSNVVPIPENPVSPSIPVQFRATMEATLHANDRDTLSSLTWYFDLPAQDERLDYQNLAETTSTFTSLVYDYSSSKLWDGSGTVWNASNSKCFKLNPEEIGCYSSDCHIAKLTDANKSPLLTTRAGSIPPLYADPDFFHGSTYIGRAVARGIPSDVWAKKHVLVRGKATYTFIQHVYFFPQGWIQPGDTANKTSPQKPLRVVNVGYRVEGTVNESYSDIWDFSNLRVADATAAWVFAPPCDAKEKSGSVSGGLVAALIILPIILIALATYGAVRMRNKNKVAPAAELTSTKVVPSSEDANKTKKGGKDGHVQLEEDDD